MSDTDTPRIPYSPDLGQRSQAPAINSDYSAPPDVSGPTAQPQFKRTVGNTLAGVAKGLLLGGLPGAVEGGVSPTTAQQAYDNERSVAQSRVRFASAQAASQVAEAAARDFQLQHLPQQLQQEQERHALDSVNTMRQLGIKPTLITDNTSEGAHAGLEQLTQSHGAVPPMFVVHLGGQTVGYDLAQMVKQNNSQALQLVNQAGVLQQRAPISPDQWQALSPEQQISLANQSAGFFTPTPDPQHIDSQIQQYKAWRDTYVYNQKNSDTPDPARADNLRKFDGTIKFLEQSRDVYDRHAINLTQSKSLAEARGKVKAMNEGIASGVRTPDGGWNPASIPVSLVEATMDPTQLTKRGKDYNQTIEQANRYSLEKYGVPFDMAKAQSDYKYSTNVQTRNTLKMIDGMTEPGGAIEIAQNTAKNLPRFNSNLANKIFNATATEFGSDEATNFHAAMLGLADEYSKVMGGGISSDTGRQQALDILKAAYSKGQLAGSIDVMRRDITARKQALVGDNRYLLREYGPNAQHTAQPQSQGQPMFARNPQTGQRIVSNDGGKSWQATQ